MAAKSFVRRARRAAAQQELPFWKRKTLAQMSKQEWESLCDGCGMCCVNKLEYEGTGELAQTDTCCKLLDPKTARCRDYKNRKKIVPDCIQLTHKVVAKMAWLPKTCGYRLVHFKQDLYWWHPLVSGDPETVHQAGISARGRGIPEDQVEDISQRGGEWFACRPFPRPLKSRPSRPLAGSFFSGSRHASSLRPVGQVRPVRQQCEPRQQQDPAPVHVQPAGRIGPVGRARGRGAA